MKRRKQRQKDVESWRNTEREKDIERRDTER